MLLVVIEVDCLEAYIMGRFFGDGWFERNGIAISTKDRYEAEVIANLMEKVYGKRPIVRLRKYGDGHSVWWIRFWSKRLFERYKQVFGTSRRKSVRGRMPRIVWREGYADICFVLGLFDAEAWRYMWRNRPRISMELYNKEIIYFIKNILDNYRIKNHISKCSDGAYRLDITGLHVYRFKKLEDSLKP